MVRFTWMPLLLALTLVLAFLGSAQLGLGSPTTPAIAFSGQLLVAGAPLEPTNKTFVFLVSAEGFNKSKTLSIAVNEGDLVRITLIYDDDAVGDNPHTIRVQDYNVEATIDSKQRTATLSFRAIRSGSFKVVCIDAKCEGHVNLQGLVLEVKPIGKPEEPKPAVKTKLTLSVSFPNIIRLGYNLALKATLQDIQGNPLAGFSIVFYINSTWGAVRIGSGYTNASGIAELAYPPPKSGTFEFTSQFDGATGFEAATSEAVIKVLPYLASRLPSQPMLTFQGSVVSLVGLVIASVWGTYAFVLSRLVRIARVKTKTNSHEERG